MVGQSETNMLTVPALQACPLVKQYAPGGLSSALLSQQLRDPGLLYLNLDSLYEMDEDALRTLLRPSGNSRDGLLEDAPDGASEPEPEEAQCPRTTQECVVLSVDEEGLQAKITLLSPPDGVPTPEAKDIMRALFQKKICRGVRVEFITRLSERPIFDQPFRIAEAQLPVNGQDSSVTFHFNPDVDLSPHTAEDGSLDYKDLDFVKSVKAGDLLCEITPATPGVDGMNIYGQPIPAMAGKPPALRCGANTVCSGDGREIRAACDGQVFLRENVVEVSQMLILDCVDFSTGNIDFPGSVHIHGNVSSGFSVQAGGDIVVGGVVEGAVLRSGGSIALCRGVNGGGNGSLEARQDIRALFIESCRAKAGGNLYADTILNSSVECGGLVSVFGKRGCLLGGVCVAGDAVSAVLIGNNAGISTAIVLNHRAGFSEQDSQLSAAAARYYDSMDQLAWMAAQDARDPDLHSLFPCELARIAILSQRLEQKANALLNTQGRDGRRPRRRAVQVLDAIYPNVSIEIDGVFAKNTSPRGRCTIYERRLKLHFTQERL